MRCLTPWKKACPPAARRRGEWDLAKKSNDGGNSLRCYRVAPPGKLFLVGGDRFGDDAGGFDPPPTLSWDAYNRRQQSAWEDTASNHVSAVPKLPHDCEDAAAAWLQGKLYVIGGDLGTYGSDEFEEFSAKVYCFDPTRGDDNNDDDDDNDGTWRRVADLRQGRCAHAAVALGGHLYAIGGMNMAEGTSDIALASVERYDPTGDAWEAVAPMPAARWCPAVAVLGEKLYLFGGSSEDDDEGGVLEKCMRFDPIANTWEPLPDLPTPRSGAAAAAFGGEVWVVGGSDGTQLKTVEVFDPVTRVWDTSKADLPARRYRPALAVLNGELHLLGGLVPLANELPAGLDDDDDERASGAAPASVVEKWDPKANSWSVVEEMTLPEEIGGWSLCAVAVAMI